MKPVILLLDDELDLVQVLVDAIAHRLPDYEVIGAGSVAEAEAVLTDLEATSTPVGLFVADHSLGGTTGLEFLKHMRLRYPTVPSILFTGRAPPRIEERAADVGARVVWKPIGLSKWLGEVQSLLQQPI